MGIAQVEIVENCHKPIDVNILSLEQILSEGLATGTELSVVNTLIESIKARSILLYGQGMYDRVTNTIDKIEILVRLYDGKQVLSPFVFLSLVKKLGLTTDFDMLVLEKALEHVSKSRNNEMIYSINLYKSTINNEACHQTIHELLKYYKIRAGRIVFEILEEDVLQGCPSVLNTPGLVNINPILQRRSSDNPEFQGKESAFDKTQDKRLCPCDGMPYSMLVKNIARYKKESAILFSVDDFPTGTNCIHNVKRMDGIDYVKIDGVWLLSMLDNFKKIFPDGEKMLLKTFHDILSKIRAIHPKVIFIVERMENEYLFNLFRRMHEIRYFQGYFFSKTKSIYDTEQEIAEHNAKNAIKR